MIFFLSNDVYFYKAFLQEKKKEHCSLKTVFVCFFQFVNLVIYVVKHGDFQTFVNFFTLPLFDVVYVKTKWQKEDNPFAEVFDNSVFFDFSLFVETEGKIFFLGMFVECGLV